MSCDIGRRRGVDLVLLWLAAAALIRPLAWEPPYAAGEALKKRQKTEKKKKKTTPPKKPTKEGAHFLVSFLVETFQKLQNAKEILTNEASRARYDHWRRSQISMPFQQWEALSDSVKTVGSFLG